MKTKNFLLFILFGLLLSLFISFLASFLLNITTLSTISTIILVVLSISLYLYIEITENIDYIDIFIFFKSLFKVIENPNPQTTIMKNFKAEKIKSKNKKVVLEVNQEINFSLDSLGFCKEISMNDKVLVLFPTLTDNGELEYQTFWYDLSEIIIHNTTNQKGATKNLKIIQQLTDYIREQIEIEKDICKQKEEQEKITKLIKLASSSKIYADQININLYKRAFAELQNLIDKGEKLKKVYFELVRETLIGKELSDYNPEQILNNHSAIESQYQQTREEYDKLKDTATAYAELLQGNDL